MGEGNMLTFLAVGLVAIAMAYQLSFLKKRKFWNLSLQQILLVVIVPGVFFPVVFSYLESLSQTPLSAQALVSDNVLVNVILVSLLFMYGGIAIHGVTKVLSDRFHAYGGPDEVVEVNRFFHLNFSHNLGFGGVVAAGLGITVLELNHIPDQLPASLFWGTVKGLVIGGALAWAVYSYTRYTTGDVGRWYDLRFFFIVLWLGFVFLLYSLRRFDPKLTDYQLLLPVLLSFSLMVILSIFLVMRRVKRGWQIRLRWKALSRYLRGDDEN